MRLLTFILICYGATNILCFGSIFDPLRRRLDRLGNAMLTEFLRCPMCVGFWTGLAVSLVGQGVTRPFFDGCIASGGCYLLHLLSEFLYGRDG